jgi:hypothetical protein
MAPRRAAFACPLWATKSRNMPSMRDIVTEELCQAFTAECQRVLLTGRRFHVGGAGSCSVSANSPSTATLRKTQGQLDSHCVERKSGSRNRSTGTESSRSPTWPDYIDTFYNRTRRHSHLGGVSAEQFEAAHEPSRQGLH